MNHAAFAAFAVVVSHLSRGSNSFLVSQHYTSCVTRRILSHKKGHCFAFSDGWLHEVAWRMDLLWCGKPKKQLLVFISDVARAREELDGLRRPTRPFNPLTIIQVKNAERNLDDGPSSLSSPVNSCWSCCLWHTATNYHRHRPLLTQRRLVMTASMLVAGLAMIGLTLMVMPSQCNQSDINANGRLQCQIQNARNAFISQDRPKREAYWTKSLENMSKFFFGHFSQKQTRKGTSTCASFSVSSLQDEYESSAKNSSGKVLLVKKAIKIIWGLTWGFHPFHSSSKGNNRIECREKNPKRNANLDTLKRFFDFSTLLRWSFSKYDDGIFLLARILLQIISILYHTRPPLWKS